MNKLTVILLLIMSMVSLTTDAQSYSQLWKKVSEAESKDLPKTKIEILEEIIAKAITDKSYGHLLKAQLSKADAQVSIAPDSLQQEVARLEVEEQTAAIDNPVLAAVYQNILGHLYMSSSSMGDDHESIGKRWYEKSMSRPDLLAATSSSDYEPMVIKGVDSKFFNNDLLHVIGMEAKAWQQLHNFYESAGMREAACLTALYLEQDMQDLGETDRIDHIDSLIKVYEDLPVCGELAIERFTLMERTEKYSAYDKTTFIDQALKKWGTWNRMNQLRNSKLWLTQPSFDIQLGKKIYMSGDEQMVLLDHLRNISQLTLTVTRVRVDGRTRLQPHYAKDYQLLKSLMVKDGSEQTHTLNFAPHEPYESFQDSVRLRGMPTGVYLVEASAKAATSTGDKEATMETVRELLYVSDLFFINEELPEKKIRIAVVNARTGRPVSGASIRLSINRNQKDEEVHTLTADNQGEAIYTYGNRKPENIYVSTTDDISLPEQFLTSGFSFYERNENPQVISIFTDRSIYRPGQTVHAAIIAFNKLRHEDAEPVAGKEFTLVLRDANNRTVKEQQVTTDSFGKAATDFVLPSSGLTGNFTIRCLSDGSRSCSIRVEEYKRPTFQLEFDKVYEAYAQGDTVEVRGMARSFSGVPVQGAKVTYSVTREPAFWLRYHSSNYDSEQLISSHAVTDDKGTFTIRVPMILPKDVQLSKRSHRYYNFLVEADVTDLGGESHHGETSLPLSTHPTAFFLDMSEKLLADSSHTISFQYTNNAGTEIPATVRYFIDNGKKSFTAEANKAIDFPLNGLRSGRHKLTAVCGSDTLQQEFIVFSMKDKRPVIETHDWFHITANVFSRDGKPVYVQMGSSDKDQHIVYSIVSGRNVLESGVIDQSNALTTRALTYKEEYGDGITLTCAWVREGKLYSHTANIKKPLPDKKLQLKWTTFRDRLSPGQKEEWTLNIIRPDGTPAHAQLLATLYDASLDELTNHKLYFTLSLYRLLPNHHWNGSENYSLPLHGFQELKLHEVHYLDFNTWNQNVLNFAQYSFNRYRPMRLGSRRAATNDMALAEVPVTAVMEKASLSEVAVYKSVETNDKALSGRIAGLDITGKQEGSKQTTSSVQLRENLTETAFFYPALTTDREGNVSLRFTLPESITTWHFMALAHDQEMHFGKIDAKAVAQKEVMIQPNMPRFLRKGDQATIAAKIINNTAVRQTGTARLQLINPTTEQVVYEQRCPYEVEGTQTTSVSFPLSTPPEDLYVCLITAEGENYSDGERHYLPVLSDKEMVTTTLPFTQHGPGTKTINLTAHLLPTSQGETALTVEYTNNPAWLMIQTLPNVTTTEEKNAISLVTAYYANTIAAHILHSSPNIKQTLELWKKEASMKEEGTSALARNQELKQLLLNETPWMAEADKEEEQQQQLISLFDENRLNSQLSNINAQLSILQNGNGSFSWWPGMPGSRMMTTAVAKTLARLYFLVPDEQAMQPQLIRALDFLAEKAHEEVVVLKKLEKKKEKDLRPSELSIDYLYIRSLLSVAGNGPEPGEQAESDIRYLVSLLAKQTRHLSIYGKANSAIILAHNGNKKKAKEYLKSLLEYTVYTEEMGRYFDTPKALYSWRDYRIPTEVAAIEALTLLQPKDSKTIDEMRRWLLQEKRTQMWDTPVNTVNAVYAFLQGVQGVQDNTLLSSSSPLTSLKIDGKTLEQPKATAGLGYVKTRFIPTETPRTFTAEKISEGTSWGAVYIQQRQSLADIASASSGIQVERELLLLDDTGKPAQSLSLGIGSKVRVRITITAERDYDFVQVVDKRAACLEPVGQLSGYHWGYYCTPRDNSTNYYFDQLSKGKHVIETDYYIDRAGKYLSGTCTVQCAYAPEYSGRAIPVEVNVQ